MKITFLTVIALGLVSCTTPSKSEQERTPAQTGTINCPDSLSVKYLPAGTTIELIEDMDVSDYKERFGSGEDSYQYEFLLINGTRYDADIAAFQRNLKFVLGKYNFDSEENFRAGKLKAGYKFIISKVESDKTLWGQSGNSSNEYNYIMFNSPDVLLGLDKFNPSLGSLKHNLGKRFKVHCDMDISNFPKWIRDAFIDLPSEPK